MPHSPGAGNPTGVPQLSANIIDIFDPLYPAGINYKPIEIRKRLTQLDILILVNFKFDKKTTANHGDIPANWGASYIHCGRGIYTAAAVCARLQLRTRFEHDPFEIATSRSQLQFESNLARLFYCYRPHSPGLSGSNSVRPPFRK